MSPMPVKTITYSCRAVLDNCMHRCRSHASFIGERRGGRVTLRVTTRHFPRVARLRRRRYRVVTRRASRPRPRKAAVGDPLATVPQP